MSNQAIRFRYFRLDGTLVEAEAETVEGAILAYRRELKRRARVDRADPGTFQYYFEGEWIS